ncbi:cardiolipin synthase (CMP-forming) isoform X6 [Equus caballus]|uniref:cardiolipin synthase (CMP-forming) isoform X6 n=1 Tax=Equus caballus TaxID=9796 RepID=UPI0038B2E145
MLASRVVRGSWGALRGVTWEPGARPGKGRARGALLPPVPSCLAGRWWLRPAALGLRLPGVGPRGHCSGAEKAAPRSAPGEDAAAEARGGPASAASLYENPWTIPNMLSMTRIGLAPVLGYLIIEEDFNIALGVFALAGLTDLVNTAVQLILVAASLAAPVFNYADSIYLQILCPPVHSCVFFVVGSSSCGMWDAASAWSDEQCHVRAQDSNRRNTGPPAAERANLTTRPRGQPLVDTILKKLTIKYGMWKLYYRSFPAS